MENRNLSTFERRSSALTSPAGLVLLAVCFIIAVVSVMEDWRRIFVVLFFTLIFGLMYFGTKVLVSVALDKTNQEVSIHLNRWGRFYETIVIPFVDVNIRFTAEKRRGSKRMVLRLYHNELEVISAEETDGWKMEALEKLVAAINEIKSNNQQP